MEFILSELRRNRVGINEQVFKREMNKIIKNYGEMYAEEELSDVFYTMNINNNGRAMAFLALLYHKRRVKRT